MNVSDFTPYLYGATTPDGRFDGLPIIDKDGNKIDFRPNPAQEMALELMKSQDGKPLRVVVLKNRQVGFSTFFLVMMTAYAHRFPHRECYLIAQRMDTAKTLHERCIKMWSALYHKDMKKGTTKTILFDHGNGMNSFIRSDTAAALKGGRGPTAHGLLLTEASRYPEGAIPSFTSAVSYSPETMILIETTANGKTGPGEAYYRLWLSAMEGKSDYLPVFIPWTLDLSCIRPVDSEFTLVDEDEERLHYEEKLTLEQIAFRRFKIEGEFGGNAELFNQEFPLTWEIAFVSTGSPVFYFSELQAVRKTIRKPISEGYFQLDRTRAGYLSFIKKRGGPMKIWEPPDEDSKYYLGADAAKCEDEQSDFASAFLWNGSGKAAAARYTERIDPVNFALVLNLMGRWYHNAMLIVELTGGWGNHVQQELKDRWSYPNLYIWKGKNDRIKNNLGQSYGWETTYRTRQDMMGVFKSAIREDDLEIRDEALVVQMENASQELGNWDVVQGHDDILMSAMIGWMARYHYPPPLFRGGRHKVIGEIPNGPDDFLPDPVYRDMQMNLARLNRLVEKSRRRLTRMGGPAAAGNPMRKKII